MTCSELSLTQSTEQVFVTPNPPPDNKFAAMIIYGGTSDVQSNLSFELTSIKYLRTLFGMGHFAFLCNHETGHTIPGDIQPAIWTFFAGLVLLWHCAPAPASTPPNIVLVYVDDLGWRDVGFMGSRYYETPHIDALAARGVNFSRAYCQSPVCGPSRMSFYTGRYTFKIGRAHV